MALGDRPDKYPEWALTSGDISEPSEGKKDTGWEDGELPSHAEANWLDSKIYEWTAYFDKFFSFSLFGDGSDGVATFDGSATPAGTTKNSPTSYTIDRDVQYTNVSVSSGVTVDANGYKIAFNGKITGSGKIAGDGNAAIGETAGATLAARTLGGGSAGAAGRSTAGNGAAGTNLATAAVGGAGGAGGNDAGGSGNTGGAGGTVTAPTALQGGARRLSAYTDGYVMGNDGSTNWQGLILRGGAGGGAGAYGTAAETGTPKSGAGGGGARVIVIAGYEWDWTGTLSVKGGAGGNASGDQDCGGGGGGGGGAIYRLCHIGTNLGSTDVTGGAGGAKTNGGLVGAAGSAGVVRSMQV